MPIVLMTDSAADYTAAEREEKNIISIPLNVTLGDETYLDGYTIDADTFYKKLSEGDFYPKTSQPSPELFLKEFNKAKENGDTVIYISMSSALSGTIQAATLAKNMAEYDDIHIVDSLLVTPAQRLLVDYVKELIDAGEDVETIIKKAEAFKGRVMVLGMVDTLEYFYKGGRLSATEAMIGDLVNIKPLVEITKEGTIGAWGKALGRSRARKALIKKVEEYPPDEKYPVLFIHSDARESCLGFKAKFEAAHPEIKTYDELVSLGPTVGSHTGPGVVAFTYVMKEK